MGVLAEAGGFAVGAGASLGRAARFGEPGFANGAGAAGPARVVRRGALPQDGGTGGHGAARARESRAALPSAESGRPRRGAGEETERQKVASWRSRRRLPPRSRSAAPR